MKGSRTIITISEQEKRWLSAYSELHHVSLAEAVRRGIACLKAAEGNTAYRELVQKTGGIWKQGDGLRYQEDIRAEWENSSC
jgi:Mor family transcriptional regulator